MVLRALAWGSLALIGWTHVGYPLAAAAAARVRRYRPQLDDDFVADVALVIAAHDEEDAIRERIENALRLDYPHGRLEILVASDGSSDGTGEIVDSFGDLRVRLLDLPRMGQVAAQNAGVGATTSEVVAFTDANSSWEPDALRKLVRNLADPEVAYVCGRLQLEDGGNGANREGLYWSYELWLREQESMCGSITAGNGGIYAVRRSAFVELEPGRSHDLGLPYRLRRRGLRSVYDPRARAREKGLPTSQAEWPRKVRMLSQAWGEVLSGGLADPRGQPPLYFAALVSHRVIRYATGPLHLVLFGATAFLARRDGAARALLGAQLAFLAAAAIGRKRPEAPVAGAAWYYLVVTAASVAGLARSLRRGPETTWTPRR
jgi:cellulose synthase/poly-beta-1,6-N-acetylglucosamine synthase-like glycosyltransferase